VDRIDTVRLRFPASTSTVPRYLPSVHGSFKGSETGSAGFIYQQDQYYIDVHEAEQQGLLPPSKATGRPKGFVEDEAISDGISTEGLKVCDRSLTYVMETEDAGFGNSLMRMWMSYGLAKAEKRAFFVDDTRWYVAFLYPYYSILTL
jgi:hypothetical protein